MGVNVRGTAAAIIVACAGLLTFCSTSNLCDASNAADCGQCSATCKDGMWECRCSGFAQPIGPLIGCRNASNCPAGEVCCANGLLDQGQWSCERECPTLTIQVCATTSECPEGQVCGPVLSLLPETLGCSAVPDASSEGGLDAGRDAAPDVGLDGTGTGPPSDSGSAIEAGHDADLDGPLSDSSGDGMAPAEGGDEAAAD